MQLQELVSNFPMTTILVLSIGIILCTLVAATLWNAQEWLARHGIHGRRDLERKLARVAESLPIAARGLHRRFAWTAGRQRAGAPDLGIATAHTGRRHDLARQADAVERRRFARYRTRFLATLHPNAKALAINLCDILDLSAGGARIRPVEPMPAMSRVTLGLERFGRIPARVVWRRDDELGLRFETEPTQVVALMRGLIAMPRATA